MTRSGRSPFVLLFLVLAGLVLGAGPLLALPQDGDDAQSAAEEEDEAGADEGEDEADEDEGDRWFAIVGGDVYTGTGEVLRNATVLSRNGQIREIGRDVVLPEGTEVLDATGMRVYPGLVAVEATSRISSGLSGPLQADDEERSNVEDSFDPFSQYLVLALATGITTAEQSNAAIKLKRGEIDGILLKEKHLTTINFDLSNPSSVRSAREKFAKTARYLRKWRAWDALSAKEKKETPEPKKPDGYDASVFSVLRGESLARFNADDREELLAIARLAQKYHFRPVIFGAVEGWTVADELGRAGAFAVLTPRARRPKDEKLVRPGGSSIENAAILHRHGVQVAIHPQSTGFDLGGITGRDLMHLPVEAAFGVRGGLPEEAALAAITIVPARILGVDHRVGTLEVGKDMDAIVTDGDLLHYETFVQWAVVSGKVVYDKQDEVFFRHIRPPSEPDSQTALEDPESPAAEGEAAASEPPREGEDGDEDASGRDEDGAASGTRRTSRSPLSGPARVASPTAAG